MVSRVASFMRAFSYYFLHIQLYLTNLRSAKIICPNSRLTRTIATLSMSPEKTTKSTPINDRKYKTLLYESFTESKEQPLMVPFLPKSTSLLSPFSFESLKLPLHRSHNSNPAVSLEPRNRKSQISDQTIVYVHVKHISITDKNNYPPKQEKDKKRLLYLGLQKKKKKQ